MILMEGLRRINGAVNHNRSETTGEYFPVPLEMDSESGNEANQLTPQEEIDLQLVERHIDNAISEYQFLYPLMKRKTCTTRLRAIISGFRELGYGRDELEN